MKEFELIKDSNGSSVTTVLAESQDLAIEICLNSLGFKVEPTFSDDKVREYLLIDNETGEEERSFSSFFYENACHEALSILGYSTFPA